MFSWRYRKFQNVEQDRFRRRFRRLKRQSHLDRIMDSVCEEVDAGAVHFTDRELLIDLPREFRVIGHESHEWTVLALHLLLADIEAWSQRNRVLYPRHCETLRARHIAPVRIAHVPLFYSKQNDFVGKGINQLRHRKSLL